MARGVLDYFPDALAYVALVSFEGNEQHNPGQPMFWNRALSTDHADCILRHMVDRGTTDTDGLLHSGKVAWRALALLQTELEAEATEVYGRSPGMAALTAVEAYNARPEAERVAAAARFVEAREGLDVVTEQPKLTAFHHCDRCRSPTSCAADGSCLGDDAIPF